MDAKTIATLAVTVGVAVAGYLATYVNSLRLAQRKDRLDRLDRQLKELYGPLFALVHASTITWEAFVATYRSEGHFKGGPGVAPRSKADEPIWRHWMQEVFMPMNEQMIRAVLDHADLLEDKQMPECVLLLAAHVYGYQGVIKAWSNEDYSRHLSLTPFPGAELMRYAERHYSALKAQQSELLGQMRRTSS